MKPRVYVETSVLGYLTSWPSGDLVVAGRQKITRDWWRHASDAFDLIVSERYITNPVLAIRRPFGIGWRSLKTYRYLPLASELKTFRGLCSRVARFHRRSRKTRYTLPLRWSMA